MSSEKQENKDAKGGKDDTESNNAKGGKDDLEIKNAEGGDNPESEKTAEAKKRTLFDAFAICLGLKEEPKFETLLDSVDLNGIIKYIKDKKVTNIITMAGAGISTSAGIPDFRSPGTGLYCNLQKYNLPDPMAIFALDYFRENPEPFCMLAKELWPGLFKPTLCHYFIRLLQKKGILLRHYTQNIDTLETIAGLDPEMCVEAHGHFRTGHCLNDECKTRYTQDWMKERIMKSEVPRCTVKGCGDLVKPDIVFFGEPLPFRFAKCANEDFEKCDLLIIMGTSLVVQPFASLPNRTNDQVPRLYINLEKHCAPKLDPIMAATFGKGFDFDGENNHRDVFWQGTCDDGCEALVDALGWGDELRALVKTEHEKIDDASNTTGASNTTPKKDTSVTTSKTITRICGCCLGYQDSNTN